MIIYQLEPSLLFDILKKINMDCANCVDCANCAKFTWVFKPIGWSPKMCITELKKLNEYEQQRLTYAGRLDPMACGLLAIVNGKDKDLKSKLMSCDKTYQFKVILGANTDTYDILGIPTFNEDVIISDSIDDKISELESIKEQEYPAYSSKTIYSDEYGKKQPLWLLANEKKLPLELPTQAVEIKYIRKLDSFNMTGYELFDTIQVRIGTLLEGSNFRQDIILDQWETLIDTEKSYTIVHCEARVSSGTYIRSLANSMGGVAYDITRTSVGDYTYSDIDNFDKFLFMKI